MNQGRPHKSPATWSKRCSERLNRKKRSLGDNLGSAAKGLDCLNFKKYLMGTILTIIKGEYMRTQLVLGMVAVAVTMSFSTAFAVGNVRASDMMPEYAKDIKQHAFSGKTTAKDMNLVQSEKAVATLSAALGLKTSSVDMMTILNKDASSKSDKIDTLATIVAGKRLATEIAKTDKAEGESLEKAVEASTKLLLTSNKIGLNTPTVEAKETAEALNKLLTQIEPLLTRYSKAERESFTRIMEKMNENLTTDTSAQATRSSVAGKSAEESFIDAIMFVKNVDRTKALEIVKKLRDCV